MREENAQEEVSQKINIWVWEMFNLRTGHAPGNTQKAAELKSAGEGSSQGQKYTFRAISVSLALMREEIAKGRTAGRGKNRSMH